jgi:predicted DsbA family dithiol-disulfide isomerase
MMMKMTTQKYISMFKFLDVLLADNPVPQLVKAASHHPQVVAPVSLDSQTKPLVIHVFIDPLCSKSWGAEPLLRKLEIEFSNDLQIEYHMVGMLRSMEEFGSRQLSKAAEFAREWRQDSTNYQMPIEANVWVEDAPHSSYPPSIAYRAAYMQSPVLASAYLRRLREMLFVEKKNISRWKFLRRAAVEVGLDVEVLLLQYNNGDALKKFANDLELADELSIHKYPTFNLKNKFGRSVMINKNFNFKAMREQLLDLYPNRAKTTAKKLSVEDCFQYYRSWTLRELEVVSELSSREVLEDLKQLEASVTVVSFGSTSGRVWNKIP